MIIYLLLFIAIESGFLLRLRKMPFPRCRMKGISKEMWQAAPGTEPGRSRKKVVSGLTKERIRSDDCDEPIALMSRIRSAFPFHGEGGSADFHCNPWFFPLARFEKILQEIPAPRVNCGTYSHLFCLEAGRHGIPTRIVISSMANFSENHVLSEYWDAARRKWIVADLLYNCLFRKDGTFLDCVELKECIFKNDSFDIVRGTSSLDGHCTETRLRDYFKNGLFSYLTTVDQQTDGCRLRMPRMLALLEEQTGRWWLSTEILQKVVLILPVLFFILGLLLFR